MSEEAGKDEWGNSKLPVEAARVIARTQLRFMHASSATSKVAQNVDEFVKQNPKAAKYAETIKANLSKLPVGVKDNPENVKRMFKELAFDDMEAEIKASEERGYSRGLEQKKIVSEAKGDSAKGMDNTKSAEEQLSAEERTECVKNKISFEDYLKAKGSKSI